MLYNYYVDLVYTFSSHVFVIINSGLKIVCDNNDTRRVIRKEKRVVQNV